MVVHRRGGPAESVEDGVTGLLFDTTPGALECIDSLRADPALRLRIGAAARERMAHRYGDRYWAELAAYYLGETSAA